MLYNLTRTRIVYRSDIAFQVPLSNFSRFRYLVHPSGDGSGWSNVEAVDVDQPHGLDYRYSQHIAKGVRKRINKEHEAFGDSTAGGEHLAGGCRILGIVESTADLTTGAGDASIDITEGKFIGRGMVYDQTNNVLWCWTNSDGTTAANPYQLLIHPDRAWAGGDVTWAGAHEFDSSVDFTGKVNIDGTLDVAGNAAFNSGVDISTLDVTGLATLEGNIYDSSWFDASLSKETQKAHGLGSANLFAKLMFKTADGSINDIGPIIVSAQTYGSYLGDYSTTNITVFSGDGGTGWSIPADNNIISDHTTGGSLRVLAYRIDG